MANYRQMYLHLFHTVTGVLQQMESAAAVLREAQRHTEELYLSADELSLTIYKADAAAPADEGQSSALHR